MTSPQILVVGSVNIDLVLRAPHLPSPGETVVDGEFYQSHGGKGANQAVAAARASRLPVAFVGAVGEDTFGQEARRQLEASGINCDRLQTIPQAATGTALILVDTQGENMIGVASGANSQLQPSDIDRIEDFPDLGILVICLEIPLPTVQRALERSHAAGIRTVLNPAPAHPGLCDSNVLPFVDVLTPNEAEAAQLTGCDVSTDHGALDAANILRDRGCAAVVLTRGALGCLVVEASGHQQIAAPHVEAIDATAAGDAFTGTLAATLANGQSLIAAARRATVAASLSVTRRGAQTSLPDREEITAAMDAG